MTLNARAGQSDDRQRVLEATDIADLIGEHLALKPKGREYVALCPFHDDHNPSMSVIPHKQIFYCHPCGAGGNAIDFVMKFHAMTFREALEFLANRAGIELTPRRPERSRADDSASDDVSSEALLKANRIALDYFRSVLAHASHGAEARAAIARRRISDQMVAEFELGAAPDSWDGLVAHLKRHSLPLKPFIAAGLIKPRNNGDGHYDALRHRLIFPILDQIGRPVAFGGRKLREEDEPKYLNSPETAVFNKSSVLFGLRQAFRAIQDRRCAIITEGYTDVIACHQAGLQHVIATLGTALTARHARVLRRLCDRIILLFDGDDAGQRAAERAFEVCFPEPIDVGIVVLPDGVDPDDLVRADKGRQTFESMVAEAQDSLEFVFRRIESRLNSTGRSLGTAGRTRAIEELVQRLVDLGLGSQPLLRRQVIIQKVARLAGVKEQIISDLLQQVRPTRRSGSRDEKRSGPLAGQTAAEQAFGCLLNDGGIALNFPPEAEDTLDFVAYGSGPIARVVETARRILESKEHLSLAAVLASLEDVEARQYATSLAGEIERITEGSEQRIVAYWQDCLRRARLESESGQERDGARQDESAGKRSLAERLEEQRLLHQRLGGNPLVLPRSGAGSRE